MNGLQKEEQALSHNSNILRGKYEEMLIKAVEDKLGKVADKSL